MVSTKLKMKQRRGVKFDQAARVIVVKRPSRDESKLLWYSKKELKRIRVDIKCSIENFVLASSGSSGSSSEETDFLWRGLERVREGTLCSSLENHKRLVKGVIGLQKLHRQMGLRDDKAFTLFVEAYNKQAVQHAKRVAKQDFAEAQQVYNE